MSYFFARLKRLMISGRLPSMASEIGWEGEG